MTDVIVVGGGIVGTAVAYHLVRDGADAVLVDREDGGRATDAGAGILSPPTSSRTADDSWFRFAIEAFAYYPELVAALRENGQDNVGYDRTGLLQVAIDDSEVAAFERAGERIDRRMERGGRPEPGSVAELPASEALDRFPPLAEPRRARLFEDAARLDGRTFTAAMRRAAIDHGLAVERRTVEEIVVEGGAATGVVTDGERLDCEAIVVAGGAWSAAFGDQLGIAVPVEPQRGQIAHLSVEGDTEAWPIVSGFREHYLVPWPGGRVAVGATREPDVGFDPQTTAAGVHEVLGEALRVAPGLADAELEEVRVGLRPASADGLPVLGPIPGVEGAYLATGHGPTGLLLGPYSGKIVAEQVVGRDPSVDVSAFRVDRFG